MRLTDGTWRLIELIANTDRSRVAVMKVANSIKTLKKRHKDCRVIRRKGRIFVINKTNPRFKARQG